MRSLQGAKKFNFRTNINKRCSKDIYLPCVILYEIFKVDSIMIVFAITFRTKGFIYFWNTITSLQ